MVTRLRNVNPVQFALVYGLMGAFLGLILAVVMIPFGAAMWSMPGMPRTFGTGFGFGFAGIIIFPIFYFVAGFISGLIVSAVFNLVARWTGGVEITLSAPVEPMPPTVQGYSV